MAPLPLLRLRGLGVMALVLGPVLQPVAQAQVTATSLPTPPPPALTVLQEQVSCPLLQQRLQTVVGA